MKHDNKLGESLKYADACRKAEKAIAARDAKEKGKAKVGDYVDGAITRHPGLPEEVRQGMRRSETKGEAKRILRDYLMRQGNYAP